ncbi:aromatic prenyltransferase [Streptomyces niveus]|uniref:aromatic prenyltransferase n=1 Tax=Streptomyces niveus TaxID=193462 RepID=UPI0033A587FA
MSMTSELADLCSAIEESARVLEVPFSHDKVRSVLTAYEDALPDAPIAFRMGTGRRCSSDVDWRFSVPEGDVDPYTLALAHGLVEPTDHPVFSLFLEVAERCQVSFYGVDFGAVGGFKKMYMAFPPDDMEPLSALLDLPSMPPSVAQNHDFFVRHGMDGKQMPMFGIDYRHRTVNLYFAGFPTETDRVRSIFRDLQLPEPSDQLLKLSKRAIAAYTTLSWDSPKIERFAFSVVANDPSDLPVPMDPEIEKFLAGMPRGADDDKFLYYVAVSSTGEEIYKFQSYYRFKSWLNPMPASASGENRAG